MPRPGTSGGGHRSSGGHSSGRVGGGHHVGSSSRRPTGGSSFNRGPSFGGGYHHEPPPPRPPRRGYYGYRRNTYTHSSSGLGTLIACIIIFAIIIFSFFMISNDHNDVTSTIENPVAYDNNCIKDELGYIENQSKLSKNLKNFYNKTGIQPYIYLKSYDESLTSDNQKDEYAQTWYSENIDNEDTFLFVYFEEQNSDEIGYMAYVNGKQVTSVMDSEAIDIFWNYIDRYWTDSSLSTVDVFTKTFDSTAKTIMKKSTTSKDIIKIICIIVGIVIVIGGIIYILRMKFKRDKEKAKENPYALDKIAKIKEEFSRNEGKAREKYPDVFYYYDGLIDTPISQSMHPAGIVASPITLADNYGVLVNDGKVILQIDMDCVHEVSLVKYDILGLKNIEIIKDACNIAGIPYPYSHEINWNDEAVWKDMLRSPVGIFEFEGEYAFSLLRQYEPHSVFDMSLVTAALRPSGASYRNDLMNHKPHYNPSPIIDELLKDNYGYLIYQEDVIKFLTEICGFSGSDADNTRRAIARKDEERLKKALPEILEGYCTKSPQPREIAEQEAAEFVQIIKDASSYMFG